MKKLTLLVLASLALSPVVLAGSESYSSKETQSTTAPVVSDWYANREWDASLWGTYAFTGNEWREDEFLGVDHAWGGGADLKYFFGRYFGLGAEGYLLDGRDTMGSALGTLTFRYPIPNSRVAPYLYAGGGAVFGNSDPFDHGFFHHSDDETKAVGQFGGGFEFRLTPHIGLTQDFNWNVVDGKDNNFGMVRAGINFAF